MKKTGMDDFLSRLQKSGELEIIHKLVDPNLEITEIADRISKQGKGGKALLFTNTGTSFPLLINALGSEKRIQIAFRDRKPTEISNDFLTMFQDMAGPASGIIKQISKLPKLGKIARIMPKRSKRKGLCQQEVHLEPDLGKLPVLKCWPADGGPFITLPYVHTVDPVTGIRNVGMYRMQVLDESHTGMHWHMHKTGARHYKEYKKLGTKMPIAVALGGDPVYTYCATAPLPDGIDEYLLAGYIRKKPVELVKCITQDMWVPNDADIVLEGYVDPEEDLVTEGPFGDHTGFYSLADKYPRFHITAITHRKNAIYPTTIVGIPPQEDAWIGQATEEIFLEPLRISMIPELIDFHLPVPGVAHNIGIFSIQAEYPGQGRKTLNSVWGAGQMMFTKFGVILDRTQNLRSYVDLAREVCARVNPLENVIANAGPLDILDHAADKFGEGGKLGIDATGETKDYCFPDEDSLLTDIQQFRSSTPEITDIRTELIKDGISVGFIQFTKSSKSQVRQLSSELMNYKALSQIRFWIFSDLEPQKPTWFEIAWVVGSHVDPARDCWVNPNFDDKSIGVLFIDASRKTKKYDEFQRDWPNPVVMNQMTIDKVNKNWEAYEIGPFIDSPSSRYLPMLCGQSAVADEA